MTPTSVTNLRLLYCPECEYDLSGLPAKHQCPECGLYYDLTMFDLPPSRGVGRLRRIRRRQWIDWIVRPITYGMIPLGLVLACIIYGVPLHTIALTTAFIVFLIVGLHMSNWIAERHAETNSRQGKPISRRRVAATSTCLVIHGPELVGTWRIHWKSCKWVKLEHIGDYPESDAMQWQIRIKLKPWLKHLGSQPPRILMACSERLAREVHTEFSKRIAMANRALRASELVP